MNELDTSDPKTRGTQTWLGVVQAYNLCVGVLNARLEVLGLSLGAHEVLMILLQSPGRKQQDVARSCYAAKSGVSVIISKLEVEGLVRREADPIDARIRRVFLTAAGTRLARKALAIQNAVVDAMAQPVSDRELSEIDRSMRKVIARLEQL
jgi:DNA-binding MarR family transcriptional regulator